MKYYILLIYLLAFSLATEGNTAVKDSLSEALPSASSPLQKLEIMTNLMDLSRQEEQVEYAKQLYWLALEEDEDYYKEAALTEILRFYVNTDAKDSAKVYLAEAERELKGKARDFLVTYMKTIMDVRVVYYTKGEDRMKLIEKYKLRLETEKDMPVLDKISNYYLLGMANSNRVDPKNQDAIYKEVCYYMNNLIELSDNIPLRYSYLFRLNTLNIFFCSGIQIIDVRCDRMAVLINTDNPADDPISKNRADVVWIQILFFHLCNAVSDPCNIHKFF